MKRIMLMSLLWCCTVGCAGVSAGVHRVASGQRSASADHCSTSRSLTQIERRES